MPKEEFDTSIRKQVLSLPDLADIQLRHCFHPSPPQNFPSPAQLQTIKRIFLTGCGDSLPACAVLLEQLRVLSGLKDVRVFNPMEFTRFTMREEFGETGSTLVIAVSARGLTSRVQEVIAKARAARAISLMVTNDPQSAAAKSADYVHWLDIPPTEYPAAPGLRSYFACLLGLLAVCCRIGTETGAVSPATVVELERDISGYLHQCGSAFLHMDEQLFSVACAWRTIERFDFIGSGRALHSALFCAEKFCESSGVVCCCDDSENWCHVNRFVKEPPSIGTVFILHRSAHSYSRDLETLACACDIGRPVLAVTDGSADELDPRANVVVLPSPPQSGLWLTSLADYGPASILAGYHSMLSNRKKIYWRDAAGNPAANDSSYLRYLDPAIKTQHNSQIEIIL